MWIGIIKSDGNTVVFITVMEHALWLWKHLKFQLPWSDGKDMRISAALGGQTPNPWTSKTDMFSWRKSKGLHVWTLLHTTPPISTVPSLMKYWREVIKDLGDSSLPGLLLYRGMHRAWVKVNRDLLSPSHVGNDTEYHSVSQASCVTG